MIRILMLFLILISSGNIIAGTFTAEYYIWNYTLATEMKIKSVKKAVEMINQEMASQKKDYKIELKLKDLGLNDIPHAERREIKDLIADITGVYPKHNFIVLSYKDYEKRIFKPSFSSEKNKGEMIKYIYIKSDIIDKQRVEQRNLIEDKPSAGDIPSTVQETEGGYVFQNKQKKAVVKQAVVESVVEETGTNTASSINLMTETLLLNNIEKKYNEYRGYEAAAYGDLNEAVKKLEIAYEKSNGTDGGIKDSIEYLKGKLDKFNAGDKDVKIDKARLKAESEKAEKEFYVNRGYYNFYKGKYDKAIEDWQEALRFGADKKIEQNINRTYKILTQKEKK